MIIAFAAEQLHQGSDLVDSSSDLEAIKLFKFLRGNYAFNRAAITLFGQRLDELSKLKDDVLSKLVTLSSLSNLKQFLYIFLSLLTFFSHPITPTYN